MLGLVSAPLPRLCCKSCRRWEPVPSTSLAHRDPRGGGGRMRPSPGAAGGRKEPGFAGLSWGKAASVPRMGPARVPSPTHPRGPGISGNRLWQSQAGAGEGKAARSSRGCFTEAGRCPSPPRVFKDALIQALKLQKGTRTWGCRALLLTIIIPPPPAPFSPSSSSWTICTS